MKAFTRVTMRNMLKVPVTKMKTEREHGSRSRVHRAAGLAQGTAQADIVWVDMCLAGCFYLFFTLHYMVAAPCTVFLPCLWAVGASADAAW